MNYQNKEKVIKKGVNAYEFIISDKGVNIEDNSGKLITFMTHDEAQVLFVTLGMRYVNEEENKHLNLIQVLENTIEEQNETIKELKERDDDIEKEIKEISVKHEKIIQQSKDKDEEIKMLRNHIEFMKKRNDEKNAIIDAFNTLIQGKL